jgi:hypothetical protein
LSLRLLRNFASDVKSMFGLVHLHQKLSTTHAYFFYLGNSFRESRDLSASFSRNLLLLAKLVPYNSRSLRVPHCNHDIYFTTQQFFQISELNRTGNQGLGFSPTKSINQYHFSGFCISSCNQTKTPDITSAMLGCYFKISSRFLVVILELSCFLYC